MMPEHNNDLNRRIPLRDEDRHERRVLSDSGADGLGCASLLFCIVGYLAFAALTYELFVVVGIL